MRRKAAEKVNFHKLLCLTFCIHQFIMLNVQNRLHRGDRFCVLLCGNPSCAVEMDSALQGGIPRRELSLCIQGRATSKCTAEVSGIDAEAERPAGRGKPDRMV